MKTPKFEIRMLTPGMHYPKKPYVIIMQKGMHDKFYKANTYEEAEFLIGLLKGEK